MTEKEKRFRHLDIGIPLMVMLLAVVWELASIAHAINQVNETLKLMVGQ